MLTRFAPSPTGYLHVGNIRTALICWVYARSRNGKFLLRLDDTDLQRSSVEYIDNIIKDLKWMGIDWDTSFKQSERFARYDEVLSYLMKEGYVYACYETKEELETKRTLQLKQGLPPVYDRSALLLTGQKKIQYEQEGRKPYYRFKLNREEVIKWNDEAKGEFNIVTSSVSDPIVKREDGNYTYMLPSVTDDIDYNVTHIIRGEDHLTNTAIQIQMIQALKGKVPIFAHLPLLHFEDNKISKRVGGLDIKSIRNEGIEAIALSNYLLKIGTSEAIEASVDMQPLIDSFDIKKFNAASVQFNLNEVYKLNSRILQKMPFEEVKERLGQVTPEFWYFIRSNIQKLSDVDEWWQICKSEINPVIIDQGFIKIALSALPEGDLNESTLSEWVKAIRQIVNIKTKDLFMQLRLVLTGKEAGPELAQLLILIGKENIVTRLKGGN
ncbi:MAG: glutamate--tRNA ligase [Wolbachia endosymbiont of Tyrophagus putrescentiae]|nr:glutamate--tRNA ligase [Wolbachia endosymbiont of Tyrophagus putrescentiae]